MSVARPICPSCQNSDLTIKNFLIESSELNVVRNTEILFHLGEKTLNMSNLLGEFGVILPVLNFFKCY